MRGKLLLKQPEFGWKRDWGNPEQLMRVVISKTSRHLCISCLKVISQISWGAAPPLRAGGMLNRVVMRGGSSSMDGAGQSNHEFFYIFSLF